MMKPYPKYKDSGVELMGEIPETWYFKKLKFLCALINNQVPINKNDSIIDLENIESWTGKLIPIVETNELENENKEMKKFENGDVLFNKLRPYLAKVYQAKENGVCGSEFLVLKPNNTIVSSFLFYRLLSKDFISVVDGATYGTKMPRASWDFIGNLSIAFPDISIQNKATAYLDKTVGNISDLIAKKERMIELLKEQRAAVINEAVTKGLDRNVKMKDSGVEWIGEVPEDWEVKRSKYVLRINTDALTEETRSNYEFNYIDIGNVDLENGITYSDKITFESAASRARRIVKKGDTVVSTVRTYLKTIAHFDDQVQDVIVSTGFAVLTPNANIIPKFLYYIVRSERFIDEICALSVGVSYPAINVSDIANIHLWYPKNINEQEKIVAYLDLNVAESVKTISMLNQQIELLIEYRTSLISEIVTGKQDVRQLKAEV